MLGEPNNSELTVSTVADYLDQINLVLATQSGRIKGEVTSINPSGKAIYFTIKDQAKPAVLNCLIWLSTYEANGIKLNVGDEIIVTGAPDVYAPYGRFAFKAQTIEYAGEGALKRAYEKLKAMLSAEGLLELERKRPLPEFPKKIGVITSMSGVVIQDFSANLGRRGYKILTVDSRVEGKDAIHDLLAALKTLAKRDIEVLVIMRGGGSWESLQAFNTESVVRAIASFKVPVLTGIGHDTDVTLAEMVADIGESTPTAVAQALNAHWDGLETVLSLLQRRAVGEFQAVLSAQTSLIQANTNKIFRSYEQRLSISRQRMASASGTAAATLGELARRVREVSSSLLRATGIMKSNISAQSAHVRQLAGRMQYRFRTHLSDTERSLANDFRQSVRRQAEAIREASRSTARLERVISTNDPKRNMKLGYSLSYAKGKLVRTVADVKAGTIITTQLADGEFTSEVNGVE